MSFLHTTQPIEMHCMRRTDLASPTNDGYCQTSGISVHRCILLFVLICKTDLVNACTHYKTNQVVESTFFYILPLVICWDVKTQYLEKYNHCKMLISFLATVSLGLRICFTVDRSGPNSHAKTLKMVTTDLFCLEQ